MQNMLYPSSWHHSGRHSLTVAFCGSYGFLLSSDTALFNRLLFLLMPKIACFIWRWGSECFLKCGRDAISEQLGKACTKSSLTLQVGSGFSYLIIAHACLSGREGRTVVLIWGGSLNRKPKSWKNGCGNIVAPPVENIYSLIQGSPYCKHGNLP